VVSPWFLSVEPRWPGWGCVRAGMRGQGSRRLPGPLARSQGVAGQLQTVWAGKSNQNCSQQKTDFQCYLCLTLPRKP
jgi:hypothetical protein